MTKKKETHIILTAGQIRKAAKESEVKKMTEKEAQAYAKEIADRGNGFLSRMKGSRGQRYTYSVYRGIPDEYVDPTVVGDWQGVHFEMQDVDYRILERLFKAHEIAPRLRKQIGDFIGVKFPDISSLPLNSVEELGDALVGIPEIEGFNCEIKLLDHWYPIKMEFQTYNSLFGPVTYCSGTFVFATGFEHWHGFRISENLFVKDGVRTPRLLADILKENDLRMVTQEGIDEFHRKTARAVNFSDRAGTQVLVYGQGVAPGRWGPRLVIAGSKDAPTRGVVENKLEWENRQNARYEPEEEVPEMPFVRLFSLQLKTYLWVDVDDLKDYVYDPTAIERLTLPPKIGGVIRTVFESSNKALFGDVIANRHGGMIILANGGPGVGKTLTAEVFAEYTKRPLYVMEIGEIGTDINELEQNLTQIFERVQKWNAVLLFDEADIFLHKRGDNLQHNAVVGIFLRLMDYYRGLLFMTTNRADAIDEAFQSRITLRLNYPDLDTKARTSIWTTMFKQSGFEVSKADVANLAEAYPKINGRQIRNAVRLMQVLFPDKAFSLPKAKEAIEFTPGLK